MAKYSNSMRTIWGRSSQSLSLPCTILAPDDGNFSLEWRKNNKLVLSAYGKDSGHAAPSLQGRVARGAGLALTIHSIRPEDSGEYHCVVTKFRKQPTRPESGASLRLIVNVAPRITRPQEGAEDYLKEGDDFRAECSVDGAPPPEVTWTKDSKIVSSSSILHIKNATVDDQGRYTCLAINVEGKEERSIELRFSKSLSFEFAPTNKTVIEGANVFWHCYAKSQPNNIIYNWYFNERPIKTTPTGLRAEIEEGDLSLREVQKSDRGWYECEATNARGEKASTSAFLDVQYVPEMMTNHRQVVTVGYGKNGTVECGVDANPPATRFSWSKNGHSLKTDNKNTYIIVNARDSDGGIYRCHATNAIGQGAAVETHVIVAEPPSFSIRPPSEIRAIEGSSLEVQCDGFGDPMPVVYWVKNQTRISSPMLTFTSIAHDDHGRYECVISNSVATVVSATQIIVERTKPQPAVIKQVICRAEESLEVFWEPGYDGSLTQTFILHFQSTDESIQRSLATSNSSALLTELSPFSVYEIQVESRNQKGSSFSAAIKRPVCSSLPSPSNVHFDNGALQWDPVPYAQSYRVETRYNSKQIFREVGESATNKFLFPESSSWKFMEARVRSLRPPFPPSKASDHVQLGVPDYGVPVTGYALCASGFLFLVLIIFWLCMKQRRKGKQRKNDCFSKVCTTSQPQTETFCEPSVNLLDEGENYDEWDDGSGLPCYPDEIIGMEFDSDEPSPVEEMLRQKYIYGAEDVPAQLVADLRIERLKREFKQSHL